MEQVQKVAKINEDQVDNEDEVKNVDGGDGERDENEISDMDKLPNEILMKILDYLDEKQLVKCRLLSTRWNEISCLLLQDKTKNNPESSLVVQLKEKRKCQIVITKSLADFLKCFGPSEAEKSSGCRRPFPFSRLVIRDLKYFKESQMLQFISTFGPHLKFLTLDIKQKDCNNFQNFWKLLLDCAPNIQQLKISGDYCLKDVILLDPVVKALNLNDTFLKNLIKLEIVSRYFGHFNNFMKDLLDHTPNLQEVLSVESDPNRICVFQHLEIWQQLNRAHLLKKLEIKSDSRSKLSPAQLMKNLRLVNFRAGCRIPFNSKEDDSIINYINHAIKSSQDTLKSLDLQSLSVENMNRCLKDIKSLPHVRKLIIRALNPIELGNILEKLSQICTNMKISDLVLIGTDFSQVARVLWTEFKGIKSLKFFQLLNTDGRPHLSILDSPFSGYSEESIGRIQAKLDQGIDLEEARQGEPQNPSISDLKGLRELEVGFFEINNQGHNFGDQVKNSLFLKLLSQLHTKKVWARNFREALSTLSSISDE